MLQRYLERVPDESQGLLKTLTPGEDHPLRVQRLGENLGEQESFGQVQRNFDTLEPEVPFAGEEEEAAELGGERCEILVGLLLREHFERCVHALQGVFEASPIPHDLGQHC